MKLQNQGGAWGILLALALAATGGAGLFLTGCGGDPGKAGPAKEEQLYTCGMHPQVIQNKPGNCPICGMKLTPVRKQNAEHGSGEPAERKIKFYKSTMNPGETSPTPRKDSMGMEMVPVDEEKAAAAESSAITIDPVTMQNMDVRTGVVTRGPLRRVVRTVGVVDFDETTLTDVTTKFKGWIEKLYVDSTGQQVHRGEPLFDIYSPELYSAQVEYLLSLNQPTNYPGSGTLALQSSALAKLKFLDIPDEQIAQTRRDGQARKTLQINAPRDGIVVEKTAVAGQLVEAGMKLYRLADLGTVWVQSQIYEQDLPLVRLGQEATVSLSYMPDRKFRGRVTYVYPTVDDKTRTAKVRMEFHNPGYFLKPGMFTTVELEAELSPSAVLVPDMAVLRSGQKNTVFVALEGGKFEPRTVIIGARAGGGMYQVLSGLKEGERVVASGQFMLDSESQLREAIQKMLDPKSAPQPADQAGQTGGAEAASIGTNVSAAGAEETVYICPMPEHVSVEYGHAGKCPLCGMTLVPVTRAALAKIQPGGKVEYYTCPMPEHNDVHEEKPGKCPRCGMTLIPVMVQPKPAPAQGGSNSGPAPERLPAKLYTCPMAEHVEVVSDQPGECPKCGMKLVETAAVSHGKAAEENWRKQHASGSAASGLAAPEHHH
jgi:multidrug efflux pump subunit AcrA (membrane-fusion protein)